MSHSLPETKIQKYFESKDNLKDAFEHSEEPFSLFGETPVSQVGESVFVCLSILCFDD